MIARWLLLFALSPIACDEALDVDETLDEVPLEVDDTDDDLELVVDDDPAPLPALLDVEVEVGGCFHDGTSTAWLVRVTPPSPPDGWEGVQRAAPPHWPSSPSRLPSATSGSMRGSRCRGWPSGPASPRAW
jgi:hypothetical protein